MNRVLSNKIKLYNNRIKNNINRAYNTKRTTTPKTFLNYYTYSNKQYDNMNEAIAKYLIDNYKEVYFKERWKQIIIAKRLNRMLRGVYFRKEKDTYNIDQYVKGIIDDVNTAIDNGKKERYLNLRLIELRNKQNNIQAFLTEDEIEDIIHDAETYPDARNILINELLEYSDDGKTVAVDTKSGGVRHYDIRYYADMVLRTALREIQTQGVLDAANEVGADLVEVSVHNTICPICIEFEGKIYSIDGKNPLFPPLDDAPPYHCNPYDKITKVLTKNKGWVFVRDIKIGDICLSLNKDTNEIEYTKITKLFKFKRNKMIKFKSKTVDIVVSKEHQMLVTSNNKKINRLVDAETLLNKKSGYFLGGGKWNGWTKDSKENDKKLNENMAEFLGYYLSDGNTIGNSGYITISKLNTNKVYKNIVNCIKKIYNGKIFELNDRIDFNCREIFDIVKPLGISYNKYIPIQIKEAHPDIIKIFLNAFINCDEHKRKRKLNCYDNGNIYFTSSYRMMSDLCECILKIGKKPSFYLIHKKGSIAKFKNKQSIRNANVYGIRELNHTYNSISCIKKQIIDYNDYAYCVELEKNHVLYVSRNGKCIWSGNCLHSLTITFESVLHRRGNIDDYIKFSNGESDIHPTARGWIPISQRKIV